MSSLYGNGILNLVNGTITWSGGASPTHPIDVQLTDNTYTEDFDAHDFENDVSAAAHGTNVEDIDTDNGTITGGTDIVAFDSSTDPLQWTAPGAATVEACILFKDDAGGPTSSPLLCYLTFSGGNIVLGATDDLDVSFGAAVFQFDYT